ncbi:hypothetical protein B0A50_04790 [Salinomyces thailandicus]|uniref:DUF7730 domain-containing protein n=1 Tax=Salinomyces thailandicus TaxID=706561 RepID=A0A4U0TXC1_9PEZI|nr:hypothetical protein B0A50_04790 [Salinomyces thailandica]
MAHPAKSHDTSRLLDLPPELRLNIYDLVLGGRTIHVGDSSNSNDTKHVHLCQASTADAQIRSEDVKNVQDLFVYRHLQCASSSKSDNNPFGRQGLSLLSVCRQIYNEAASIPFSTNTFTFSTPAQISQFTESLTPEQKHQLSNITLYSTGGARNWSKPLSNSPFPHTQILLLPGLKHLTLYLELCPLDLGGGLRRRGSMPPSYAGGALGDVAKQDLHNPANLARVFAGVVDGLKSAVLGSVEVKVVDTSGMRNYQHQLLWPLEEALVEEWKERVRRDILGV